MRLNGGGKFMKIRGHHLVCVLSFDATEFSDELASQFISMRRTLLEKDRTIEVVVAPDDACGKCNHLSEEGCTSPEDGPEDVVRALDRKVLAALGMEPGLHLTGAIHPRFLNLDDAALHNICSSCSFYGRSPCRARFRELTERFR
jgi:hypothetical protein